MVHYFGSLVKERCNSIANTLELCLSCTYTSIDGLVHERRNSIAYALELCLSCSNPWICLWLWFISVCKKVCPSRVPLLHWWTVQGTADRLLHSPNLVAIGLSAGYETWLPFGYIITLLSLVGLYVYWDCLVPHCIMGWHDQWEFPPFFRPQWQSLCTALTCLPLGLCKWTVKESMRAGYWEVVAVCKFCLAELWGAEDQTCINTSWKLRVANAPCNTHHANQQHFLSSFLEHSGQYSQDNTSTVWTTARVHLWNLVRFFLRAWLLFLAMFPLSNRSVV